MFILAYRLDHQSPLTNVFSDFKVQAFHHSFECIHSTVNLGITEIGNHMFNLIFPTTLLPKRNG